MPGTEKEKAIRLIKGHYKSLKELPDLIEGSGLNKRNIDDHYIPPNIVFTDYDSVRITVDPLNIFSSLGTNYSSVSKVLITGLAGVGKSTLLHWFAYKSEELFPNLGVFKVRLKDLTEDSWKATYKKSDIQTSPLSCLIHNSLPHDLRDQIPVHRIREILSDLKGNLILIDAYDEILHLLQDSNSIASKVIEEAFRHYHIIMTSRSNSVSIKISSLFREIVNEGLSGEGLDKFICDNFSNADEALGLKGFLEKHGLYKICSIPVNAGLICFLWQSDNFRSIIGSGHGINLSTLYDELIVYLGERYINKFYKDKAISIVRDTIYNLPEVKCMGEMAFDAMQSGQVILPPSAMSASIKKYKDLTLDKIREYGLLKADVAGCEVNRAPHLFIHKTFLEYNCAMHMFHALDGGGDVASKMAGFLSLHRHDIGYLVTLQFLSGSVSNHYMKALESKDTEKISKAESLLLLFWETMSSNACGIIELGEDQKVCLWIDLILQSHPKAISFMNEKMHTIPRFIDHTICLNIFAWGDYLIKNGFLTVGIRDKIIYSLESEDPDTKEKALYLSTRLIDYDLVIPHKQAICAHGLSTLSLRCPLTLVRAGAESIWTLWEKSLLDRDTQDSYIKKVSTLMKEGEVMVRCYLITILPKMVRYDSSIWDKLSPIYSKFFSSCDSKVAYTATDVWTPMVNRKLLSEEQCWSLMEMMSKDDAIDALTMCIKLSHGLVKRGYTPGKAIELMADVISTKTPHVHAPAMHLICTIIKEKPDSVEKGMTAIDDMSRNEQRAVRMTSTDGYTTLSKEKGNFSDRAFEGLCRVTKDDDYGVAKYATRKFETLFRLQGPYAEKAKEQLKAIANDPNSKVTSFAQETLKALELPPKKRKPSPKYEDGEVVIEEKKIDSNKLKDLIKTTKEELESKGIQTRIDAVVKLGTIAFNMDPVEVCSLIPKRFEDKTSWVKKTTEQFLGKYGVAIFTKKPSIVAADAIFSCMYGIEKEHAVPVMKILDENKGSIIASNKNGGANSIIVLSCILYWREQLHYVDNSNSFFNSIAIALGDMAGNVNLLSLPLLVDNFDLLHTKGREVASVVLKKHLQDCFGSCIQGRSYRCWR